MDIYTVSFFGHRNIENYQNVYEKLTKLIKTLLSTKNYVEFLVGRNGEFDKMVTSIIKSAKRTYRDDNSSLCLILPYMSAELRDNEKSFFDYYDEIEVYETSSNAHFKSAIQIRNRYIIDKSDLTVFYVNTSHGGAYQTYCYAKNQNKNIINLGDI